MAKGKVTIKRSGGGYDIRIGGRGVSFGKTRKEAWRKAEDIRAQRKRNMKPTGNRAFIGTVNLKIKGKSYGATTRQINAASRSDATKKLKKNFAWPGNTVTVSKLHLKSKKCKAGTCPSGWIKKKKRRS